MSLALELAGDVKQGRFALKKSKALWNAKIRSLLAARAMRFHDDFFCYSNSPKKLQNIPHERSLIKQF